jgi:NUMOD3 motif/GIY-YIG catalytic domain/NUMOD1 domain
MKIFELIILVFSIPLASLYLSTIFPSGRKTFLIFVLTVFLLTEANVHILGGLCQTNLLSESLEVFILTLGSLSFMEQSNILLALIPIVTYSNAETAKSSILSGNKNKSGVYMWVHNESGKRYIGSAFDLSKRLRCYYSVSYLNRAKSMYVCRALLDHGYSAFSLVIIEYIDITNLSIEKSKELILEKEQYHLDNFLPEYNILKVAGSSLGYKHTEETLVKISGDNHQNYGKIHSESTKVLMSEAKSGEKHPRGMQGKTHSAGTIAKISQALSGDKNPFYGKTHISETLAKISAVRGTIIYVYNLNGILVNTFCSGRKAAEHFDCSQSTIFKYSRNGLVFKGQWILSTSLITKE